MKAASSRVWTEPSSVPFPVRAAIKARVLAASLGRSEAPPRLEGRYRLIREIGRGGVGTVWEAEHVRLERRVAIKMLRPSRTSDPDALRLLREAVTVSRIGHDHIVQVLDVGSDDAGSPYVVMELLEGRPLNRVVADDGPIPWERVATIGRQLCQALQAAHGLGIVHRDLKPANVFVTQRNDGRPHCKLLDFGLCRTPKAVAEGVTRDGAILGTPGYMAPEQIRGQAVDGRTDLYSLGCVLYELAAGRPAFCGPDAPDVLSAQLHGRCASLGRCAPHLPRAAVAIVTRAMSVRAGDRYPDAATLERELAAVSDLVPSVLGGRTRRALTTASVLSCAVAGALAVAPSGDEPVRPRSEVRPSPIVVASEPAQEDPAAPPQEQPAAVGAADTSSAAPESKSGPASKPARRRKRTHASAARPPAEPAPPAPAPPSVHPAPEAPSAPASGGPIETSPAPKPRASPSAERPQYKIRDPFGSH